MASDNRILQFFPYRLRDGWERSGLDFEKVREIRLRVNRHVRVLSDMEHELPFVYGDREMEEIFGYLCHDSVYAYEEERTQGYLMAGGGHRVGITGELVAVGGGRFSAKYIRYMNIRLAHEHKNIAVKIIGYICRSGKAAYNTLIISPPGTGKTTLLRDTIRLLSNGIGENPGCNVGVVDERGEIAGAYRGSASLDCGERTDVITGGDKRSGISILVRTFSPSVVAVDEIGKASDAEALLYAGVSGCSVLATVHGGSIEDISHKDGVRPLLESGLLDRFVVLSMDEKMDRYFEVFDREGKRLCGRSLLRVPLL